MNFIVYILVYYIFHPRISVFGCVFSHAAPMIKPRHKAGAVYLLRLRVRVPLLRPPLDLIRDRVHVLLRTVTFANVYTSVIASVIRYAVPFAVHISNNFGSIFYIVILHP